MRKEQVTINPASLRKSSSAGKKPQSTSQSIDERKKISRCGDCDQKGHWGGDPECPMVKSGKTKPHQKKASSSHVVQLVKPNLDVEWVMYVEHITDKEELKILHELHDNTKLDTDTLELHTCFAERERESRHMLSSALSLRTI